MVREVQAQRLVEISTAMINTFGEVADVATMAASQRALRTEIGDKLLSVAMTAVKEAAKKGQRDDDINAGEWSGWVGG